MIQVKWIESMEKKQKKEKNGSRNRNITVTSFFFI